MSNVIVIIKRTGYTEAQKRASYKWRSLNREKVAEGNRRYQLRLKERTSPFLELCNMVQSVFHPEFKKKRAYTRKVI
jgi:hypothetical protein